MQTYNFFARNKRRFTFIIFILIFLYTLFQNIPTFILANAINTYSQKKLKLYDTSGTFWNGSGLLVAVDTRTNQSAPLILVNWDIKLGLTKFIDIKFSVGSNQIADVYLNKHGLNLSKLNLSLSVSQVTELFGLIKNLGLSGNVNVSTDQMLLSKKSDGIFTINLTAVSSSISPVNPLGDYKVIFNADKKSIDVTSSSNSTLILNGNGTTSSLTLKARIAEDKKEKMLQFITVMGMPQPDGSYNLKIL